MNIELKENDHSSIDTISSDVCIIGGGVGGLSLSILLVEKGFDVVLVEKETYPYHKVCGEYVSMESWGFLESIGVPLRESGLPVISKLLVTSPGGHTIKHDLPLGGFGISRYKLDHNLYLIAKQKGVQILEDCKVTDVAFTNDQFIVSAGNLRFNSRVCVGSFGKKANLDIRWKRSFVIEKPNKLNNYIGVKYHVKTDFPTNTIALHNFENGYCGLSKIEDDLYCCCYLTTADNLKKNNNSIKEMEKSVLYRNPYLRSVFERMEIAYDEPLVISQVSFAAKTNICNHVLLLGDAAGMIAPLCGNGMSMAMLAAKIAASEIVGFLINTNNREQMEINYQLRWKKSFESRLRTGRIIQSLFGKTFITDLFIRTLKPFPGLINKLILQTHGQPF